MNITDSATIANKLNEYFVKIGIKLAHKIPDNISHKSHLIMVITLKVCSYFKPVTGHELLIEIDNLNENKTL